MPLTQLQQLAFDSYLAGDNLFITGDAGTGKSFLIDRIIDDAVRRKVNVLAVAPTGKAAQNIRNGVTIHSAFMMDKGVIPPGKTFMGRTKGNVNILDVTDLLVIDEVSMVRLDNFAAMIGSIRRAAERSKRPKQIVVAGDFCQLPPVLVEKKDGDAYRELYGDSIFAFGHAFFDTLTKIRLTEKMRSRDDLTFMACLDRLRYGDPEALRHFRVSKRKADAVTLCSTNKEAEDINLKMLERLEGQRTYQAAVQGEVPKEDMFAPERLTIAPGARIIMTVNDDKIARRWTNGTEAEVVECLDDSVLVRMDGQTVTITQTTVASTKTVLDTVHEDGEDRIVARQVETGKYIQMPFKLGWAITIHKSQGMTLDEVNIDPSRCFAHGQLYVAVSRCRSLAGIHMLKAPKPEHLICMPEVRDFMQGLDSGENRPAAEKGTAVERSGSGDGNGGNAPEAVAVDSRSEAPESAASSAPETGTDPVTADTVTPPSTEEMTVKEFRRMIEDHAGTLMARYGISGRFVCRIITEDSLSKSLTRRLANDRRRDSLERNNALIGNMEIRKRLVAQDANTQCVYHCLREESEDGISTITARDIAKRLGNISKRSVESGLRKLRDAGLIISVGSARTPRTRLPDVSPADSFQDCVLLHLIRPTDRKRMQQACSTCTLDCPRRSEILDANRQTPEMPTKRHRLQPSQRQAPE